VLIQVRIQKPEHRVKLKIKKINKHRTMTCQTKLDIGIGEKQQRAPGSRT